LINIVRFLQIGVAVYGHLAWWGLVRIGLWRSRLTPAQGFSRMLQRLGTPFVKLGQGLSMHRELLPDDYVAALTSLQDHVQAFPGEAAVREIEAGLGGRITELFADFSIEPLAAASIAQVHVARLHDGRVVIVKVRRPGIKRQVQQDLRIVRLMIRLALLVAPALQRLDPLGMVHEVQDNLHKEMDFRQEARNVRRFTEVFRDSRTIFVPPAIDGLVAESVMVQVMSVGLRIDDPSLKQRGPVLAGEFVDAFLYQFFVVGLFHGDPHPGNLFVMDDNRLCLHDFGLIGFLDRETRQNLAALMQAFVHQDAEWLLDAYLDLGMLGGSIDREEFKRGLEELIQDYARRPLREWSFAEALLRISRMGRGQNVRLPANLLVLMRTAFLMESTVRILDPDFNLMDGLLARAATVLKGAQDQAAPLDSMARIKFEAMAGARDIPFVAARLLYRVRRGEIGLRLQHHGLEDLEKHIDRSSNRMALALVTLGLYIASSLLMQHSIGPRIGDTPVLAIVGYGLALWFTLRLIRGISASGRL
jgi:ubiquinone biosynthesis protein